MQRSKNNVKNLLAAILFLTFVFNSNTSFAQTTGNFAAERERAVKLVNENKFLEALPLLEKLAASKEADAQIFLGIGLSYWRLQNTGKDRAAWKQMRLKAKQNFLKAKELGASEPEIDVLVASIKPDGGDKNQSDNPQAQALSEEAFQAFAAKDYKKAASVYQKAATLDPAHYESALYTGNSYYALKDYDKSGIWFAKAIALDPNRETAYRYWGDALMNGGKNKEAQDKFFDAVIAEPYSNAAWKGLLYFAQLNNIKMAHPKIDNPVQVSFDENGNLKMNMNGESIIAGKDNGTLAWTAYGLTRSLWRKEKFARAFPSEKKYRHSLMEEADALRSVLVLADEKKSVVKNLSPDLAALKTLSNAGLLEAYILLARADDGIRQDYAAYRQNNREKLNRYLAEYVVKNGGN